MTDRERRDLQTRKRILDKIGQKSYCLRDSAGRAVFTKRTTDLAERRKDLERRRASLNADERRELAVIEAARKIYSGRNAEAINDKR